MWRAEHLPFGGLVNDEPSVNDIVNNLRFPGQYFEAETGLHQNWFRSYQPSIGRFHEPDPLGLAAGASLFGYAAGNPISVIDPTGLVCEVYQWRDTTLAGHWWLMWPNGGSAGFYPEGGTPRDRSSGSVALFTSVPGFVKPDAPDVTSEKRDTTWMGAPLACDRVAQCLEDFAATYADSHSYCVATNNCRDFTQQALAHCGLKVYEGPTCILP